MSVENARSGFSQQDHPPVDAVLNVHSHAATCDKGQDNWSIYCHVEHLTPVSWHVLISY